jgi:hypothetical protein
MADVEVKSTATDTVDIVGLDNVKAGLTLGLVQPFKTESAAALELKPLTTTSTVTAELKPLSTTSTAELKPVKTDSSLTLDLKPAVVDLCLTANVGKVPSLCIRQPYRHSIAFTLFGAPVWSFTFSGEQETIVEERHPPPQVAPGAQSWPAQSWAAQQPRPSPPARSEPAVSAGGLRIRLGS